uniref:Uncharacterized protein n=1 Tax=viral metagenome TaxID=1070528 RepID=A0A6M3L304_9ZZZZ
MEIDAILGIWKSVAEKGVVMTIDDKSSYYDIGGIETIEIIKAKLNHDKC